jgi:hypothetical protein
LRRFIGLGGTLLHRVDSYTAEVGTEGGLHAAVGVLVCFVVGGSANPLLGIVGLTNTSDGLRREPDQHVERDMVGLAFERIISQLALDNRCFQGRALACACGVNRVSVSH